MPLRTFERLLEIFLAFAPARFRSFRSSIPLAHFEDMPETLPELTFEGDVPISLEFTGVTEKNNIRTAMFRWTNHTNKDIHQVRVKTDVLDAAGTVIKQRDASPSGSRFLLDFGESEETIHVGSGPPEGTVSARATLQSITFVNATEWNATENQ
jgi:hypothetical protein